MKTINNLDLTTRRLIAFVAILWVVALVVLGAAFFNRDAQYIIEAPLEEAAIFNTAIKKLDSPSSFLVTQTASQKSKISLIGEEGADSPGYELSQKASGTASYLKTSQDDFDFSISQDVESDFMKLNQKITSIGNTFYISINDGSYAEIDKEEIAKDPIYGGFAGIKESFTNQLFTNIFKDLQGIKVSFEGKESINELETNIYSFDVSEEVFNNLFNSVFNQMVSNFANSGIDVTREDLKIDFEGAESKVWIDNNGNLLRHSTTVSKINVGIKDIAFAELIDSVTTLDFSNWNSQDISIAAPKFI